MKTVVKAIKILELFLDNQGEMSLGEIANQVGENKTTVYKIVSTLVKYGYLRQPVRKGKYSLGWIYNDFADRIKNQNRLRMIALPYINQLGQTTGEMVTVAFGNENEGIYSEIFQETPRSENILRVSPQGRVDIILHCTATGKILLANMGEAYWEKYFLGNNLKRYTPKTITDPDKLKKQLAMIKKEGIAYDIEEYSLGVKGIGVSIKDNHGNVVGAISILAPSIRMNHPRMVALETQLKQCALKISQELGFKA